MNILSIQSHVAYGHVGNASAVFPLQRLGAEVWAVNTVQFSNHTGYGAWRGLVMDPAVIAEVIEGVADRDALTGVDAVLTGYQGSPGVAAVVLDTVARVRALNPDAVYCADPVMGDVGRGMFVLPGFGLPIGFVLGLLLAEWYRMRDFRKAAATSWETVKALGVGILIELGCAMLAVAVLAVSVATAW